MIGKVKKVPKFTPGPRPSTPVTEAMRAVEDASAENDWWDLVSVLMPAYARKPPPADQN